MATRTISPAGGKWGETSAWVEGAVPTAADDVVATAESGSVTIGAAAVCRSINLANYVGTLKHEGFTLKIGDATAGASNIALKFPAGMTYTGSNVSSKLEFVSSSATEQTIETGGKSLRFMEFNGTGKWKLASAVTLLDGIQVTKGTFNSGAQTITTPTFTGSSSNTRTITLDGSTIGLTRTSSTVWNMETTTGLTFSATGSTIKILDTGASNKTFTGGGLTYGTLYVEGGGAGIINIGLAASNTFQKLEIKAPKTVKFGAGKTQTVSEWNATGSAGNLITIESNEAGTKWILKKTTGTVSSDYLSLKDSKAEGGVSFFAGTHSTNVSGNEGWTFTGPSGKPVVTTESAPANVAATLEGTVNPAGLETEYWFEYGTTEAYGTKTEVKKLSVGSSNVAVTQLISSLTAATVYHYRVVTKNSEGEVKGTDHTFTASGGGGLALIL